MDRIEGLRGSSMHEAAGAGAIWGISDRARAEAERRTVGRGAPRLVPATHGCASCGAAPRIVVPNTAMARPAGVCLEPGRGRRDDAARARHLPPAPPPG